MTRTGGGASPDVCPRAPDTLATPLHFRCSGVAKKPGHFEVRTSSSQVIRKHFFPQKVDDLFSLLSVARKTQRPPTTLRLFHCQNKTNKAVSGQIW